jgi:hypothetical protein
MGLLASECQERKNNSLPVFRTDQIHDISLAQEMGASLSGSYLCFKTQFFQGFYRGISLAYIHVDNQVTLAAGEFRDK